MTSPQRPFVSIGAPQLESSARGTSHRVAIRCDFGPGNLWYSVASDHAHMLSTRADAALIALLVPAMRRGLDIVIEGPVTHELLHQVEHGYQELLVNSIPGLKRIAIRAHAREAAVPSEAAHVATGFSAGVDSFMTVQDYYLSEEVPAAYRLTHLLFNNVGSHYDASPGFIEQRLARVRAVAASVGLPVVAVDSNLRDYYRGWRFLDTHIPRNASVGFVLQSGLARWLYSVALPYGRQYVTADGVDHNTEPVAVSVLSTPSLTLRATGGEYTRVEKTLRIAQLPAAWSTLDVCTKLDYDRNCSTCTKCMRTLVTLDLAGLMDRFAPVFHLDRYARAKPKYLAMMVRSENPFEKEITAFARERGIRFASSDLARGQVQRVSARVRTELAGLLGVARRWRQRAGESSSSAESVGTDKPIKE